MYLCSFSPWSTTGVIDATLRDDAARRSAMPSAPRRCRRCGCRCAPASRSRSSAATALPPVASIGSIISTKLDVEARGQLRVVPRGDGRHLVALQADVADARAAARARARRRACRARRAAPARRRCRRRRAGPAAGPSGVSTVDVARRDVAQRFGREQHADARRGAAEMLGRRALVAQVDERVVHERMIDEVDRHGATLYNFCLMRASTVAVVFAGALVAGVVAAGSSPAAAPRRVARRHRRHRRHRERQPPDPDARRRRHRRRRRSSTSDRPEAIAARYARHGTPSTPATRSCCPA